MNFDIKGLYYSSVSQNLIIGALTLFLYYFLGSGMFGLDESGDQQAVSENQSLIQFNSLVIFYIIFSLLIGSIIFYLIFTRLKNNLIRVIYTAILGLSFLLFLFELFMLMLSTEQNVILYVIYSFIGLGMSLFGAKFLLIYAQGKPDLVIRNAGIIISAVIIGRIMAIYFDLISIMTFALILAVFDIYSVFKGPLSKIMGKPRKTPANSKEPNREQLEYQFRQIARKGTPVIMSYQNTILGIGDILFFSILMYKSLMEWQIIGMVVTTLAISLGSLGTLVLLQKLSPLPGLPLPVSLSLIGYVFMASVLG